MDIVALAIVSVIFSSLFGLVIWLVQDLRATIRENLNAQDKRVTEIERKITHLKEALPRTYVLRDDYIRLMASFQRKLEDIESILRKGEKINERGKNSGSGG